MKNSIKQMLRTPWRTGLFLLLILLSTALFMVGMSLFLQTEENLRRADKAFVTIGTVKQKANTMRLEEQWDAALKDNIYSETPVYNEIFSTEILKIPGIEYISGPEQRPYYGAFSSDFKFYTNDELMNMNWSILIAEFQPVDDCLPDEPVQVEIKNVLFGNKSLIGNTIFFCDHFSKQTQPMDHSKTYIAFLKVVNFNSEKHESLDEQIEYAPMFNDERQFSRWVEVYDGFYETEQGKCWINLVDEFKKVANAVPITPTEDTQLLYPFHQGDAKIVEGSDIQPEEYESGEKVCLVSQSFAKLTGFGIGDVFNLQFYYTDYSNSASQVSYWENGGLGIIAPLDSQGVPFNTFQSDSYRIAGIYSSSVAPTGSGYDTGIFEIIVPSKSISKNSEQNIVARGAMQGYNCTFRIPNGTIDKTMEAFSTLPESNFLEIQFYDNGYEHFAAGLKNLMVIAVILLFTGLASVVTVLAFFLYFAIVKQQKRTAIERSLGMTKRQCVISLLTGILLLTTMGTIAGGLTGIYLNRMVQKMDVPNTEYFSITYTRGVQDGENQENLYQLNESRAVIIECLIMLIEIILVCILSLYLINQNLKITPIYFLGRREDE